MPTASTARIGPSRHPIPEIMRVIDEIAFFTNIIALQAAVGAAEGNDALSPEPVRVIASNGNAAR